MSRLERDRRLRSTGFIAMSRRRSSRNSSSFRANYKNLKTKRWSRKCCITWKKVRNHCH